VVRPRSARTAAVSAGTPLALTSRSGKCLLVAIGESARASKNFVLSAPFAMSAVVGISEPSFVFIARATFAARS